MATVLTRGVLSCIYLAALLEVMACASAGSLFRVHLGVSVQRLTCMDLRLHWVRTSVSCCAC